MTTKYHILYPHNKEEDCINDINQLGEFTYPKEYVEKSLFYRKTIFTKLSGYYILEELIKKRSKVLDYVKIFSSNGKEYSVEKFFDLLSTADVIQ